MGNVQLGEYGTAPYMIERHNEQEALYGKPVLLTDCEVAMLLDALPKVTPTAECHEEQLKALWVKMLALWEAKAPYAPAVGRVRRFGG